MLKGYKYRLYPNIEQKKYLAKTFGCTRFIYNKMLGDRIKSYEENKKLNINKIKYPTPAQYKSEFQWLKEVDSLALANAQLNLNKAYKNFFRNKAVGFPKFKSKKNNRFNFTTNNQNGTVYIENGFIKIPKLTSMLKIKQHKCFTGLIKSCTISQVPSGKYYIAILVYGENIILPKTNKNVGIDLGIKRFATTSDDEFFINPNTFKKSAKRLAKLQKDLSRKKNGSNNNRKARVSVARLHEKIANQRADFLQKLSTQFINENQVIVIEDLQVGNMMKNHILAKSIADVSWNKFRRMLEYKAVWYGKKIIVASPHYASSQLCSNCNNKSTQTKNLSCRTYICPICGMIMDRDLNASKNLLKLVM
jgi:putative transposase